MIFEDNTERVLSSAEGRLLPMRLVGNSVCLALKSG